MGFTFLMDANTSDLFLQLFHGSEANSDKPLKNEKKSMELTDYFYLFLILKNIYVYIYFISIQASIRNVKYYVLHSLNITNF